jgi:hypothetical protein
MSEYTARMGGVKVAGGDSLPMFALEVSVLLGSTHGVLAVTDHVRRGMLRVRRRPDELIVMEWEPHPWHPDTPEPGWVTTFRQMVYKQHEPEQGEDHGLNTGSA